MSTQPSGMISPFTQADGRVVDRELTVAARVSNTIGARAAGGDAHVDD